jgi:hypothetical protein
LQDCASRYGLEFFTLIEPGTSASDYEASGESESGSNSDSSDSNDSSSSDDHSCDDDSPAGTETNAVNSRDGGGDDVMTEGDTTDTDVIPREKPLRFVKLGTPRYALS